MGGGASSAPYCVLINEPLKYAQRSKNAPEKDN